MRGWEVTLRNSPLRVAAARSVKTKTTAHGMLRRDQTAHGGSQSRMHTDRFVMAWLWNEVGGTWELLRVRKALWLQKLRTPAEAVTAVRSMQIYPPLNEFWEESALAMHSSVDAELKFEVVCCML